jgi:hypothetical protein
LSPSDPRPPLPQPHKDPSVLIAKVK